MKSFYKKILPIALAIMLTGCFPSERRNTLTEGFDFVEETEKIDNFSLSLSLPQNCPKELPEITATAMRWDKDAILNVFQGSKTIILDKEYDSDRYPQ